VRVIQSFESGEEWGWCCVDEVPLALPTVIERG
jgi:hypothetical protein